VGGSVVTVPRAPPADRAHGGATRTDPTMTISKEMITMTKQRKPKVPGTKVRPLDPHRRLCLVVGDYADPVIAVQYAEEKLHPRDSGYRVYTTSAPSPDDADADDFGTLCLNCFGRRHPEAARGFLLAKGYGEAWWDEEGGEWVAEDEDGNEVVFDSGDEPIGDEDEADGR
jgi:hypothetical protein